MLRRTHVGDTERVLVIRHGRFERVLEPGRHWVFGLGVRLERHNVRTPLFTSEWSDYLVAERPDIVERHFTVIETGDTEVAAVFHGGKIDRVLNPGSRELCWRAAVKVTSEVVDFVSAPRLSEAMLKSASRLGLRSWAVFHTVAEGHIGLVTIDGKPSGELAAGRYGYWRAANVSVEQVELRRQTIEVAGQEILTADKVAIRVNVSAVYQVVDARAAQAGVKDVNEHLYRTLQIAVRQYLGKRTLEQMLAEKTDLDAAVAATVRGEVEPLGVRLGVIAIKDVILPGDVRDILNQVVTAEKQAQANLIRRREEVASTRSLLNTAKLMEANPTLIRLKELEALEKIAEKVDKITVVGGLNKLVDGSLTVDAN